jgi:hypothetical protein
LSRRDNQIPVRKISLALLSRRDNHLLAATAEFAILFAATLPSRLMVWNGPATDSI